MQIDTSLHTMNRSHLTIHIKYAINSIFYAWVLALNEMQHTSTAQVGHNKQQI